MPWNDNPHPSRRQVLSKGVFAVTGLALARRTLLSQSSHALDVACAGSIRAMLESPLKSAAAQELQLDLRTNGFALADDAARLHNA